MNPVIAALEALALGGHAVVAVDSQQLAAVRRHLKAPPHQACLITIPPLPEAAAPSRASQIMTPVLARHARATRYAA